MSRLLMAVGIVLALVATAGAEPPAELYPGSRCFPISEKGEKLAPITVRVESLIVAGVEAAESHLTVQRLDVCLGDLGACQGATKPPPRWVAPAKWAAVGVAIGAAFIGGAWLGSR